MLKYEVLTGQLFDAAGKLLGTGYSGKDPYKNDPSAEGMEGAGPIPRGNWKLVSLELTTPLHGPYVIVLEPDADTRGRVISHGRDPSSFRIHGDSLKTPGSASEGCLIIGRPIREQIWTGTDHDLEVV
jgi:hypothetical protein